MARTFHRTRPMRLIAFLLLGAATGCSGDGQVTTAPPPPLKVGTVYRYHATIDEPDVSLGYWADRRKAPPRRIVSIDTVATVTASDAKTRTEVEEKYVNGRLDAKWLTVMPDSPFLGPVTKKAIPIPGKPPSTLSSTATATSDIDLRTLLPLSVGRKWRTEWKETSVVVATPSAIPENPGQPTVNTTWTECEVTSRGTITVPAGTFPVFVVSCGNAAPLGHSGALTSSVTRYYAPALGLFVRTESITPMAPAPIKFVTELVSLTVPQDRR